MTIIQASTKSTGFVYRVKANGMVTIIYENKYAFTGYINGLAFKAIQRHGRLDAFEDWQPLASKQFNILKMLAFEFLGQKPKELIDSDKPVDKRFLQDLLREAAGYIQQINSSNNCLQQVNIVDINKEDVANIIKAAQKLLEML